VLFHASVVPEAAADGGGKAGLWGEYYALEDALEDFPAISAGKKPTLKRVDKNINVDSTTEAWPGTELVDHFYIRWTGKLRTPKDGNYTFFLESDDGSRLFIDGKQVVDNGGLHAMEEKSGEVELKAGEHELKVEFSKTKWMPAASSPGNRQAKRRRSSPPRRCPIRYGNPDEHCRQVH